MTEQEMKYCEICGKEITEKDVQLATGEWICEGCVEESNEIVHCDTCGKWHWARNTINKGSETFCKPCLDQQILKIMNTEFKTLKKWNDECDEDGEPEFKLDKYHFASKFRDPDELWGHYDWCFSTRYEVRRAAQFIAEGWGCEAAEKETAKAA